MPGLIRFLIRRLASAVITLPPLGVLWLVPEG